MDWYPVPFDRLIPYLKKGKGDLAAAGITVTPDRLHDVDFTRSYLRTVDEVVVSLHLLRHGRRDPSVAGGEERASPVRDPVISHDLPLHAASCLSGPSDSSARKVPSAAPRCFWGRQRTCERPLSRDGTRASNVPLPERPARAHVFSGRPPASALPGAS